MCCKVVCAQSSGVSPVTLKNTLFVRVYIMNGKNTGDMINSFKRIVIIGRSIYAILARLDFRATKKKDSLNKVRIGWKTDKNFP